VKVIIKKLEQYRSLIKFNVDIVVALTAVFGYLIAEHSYGLSLVDVIVLFFSGFFVTATAHIINQLIEVKNDAVMLRTRLRPLVTGSISKKEAVILAVIFSITGLGLLYYFIGYLPAFISFVSLVMYAFIYTPLKQINRIAIWIGAIPGALPVLIGYVAATGKVDLFAILLFGFQVVWQLPHFWSIAWIWHEEYLKGGYDLMPYKGGKTKLNAFITFLSSFGVLPFVIAFYYLGYINFIFLILLLIASFYLSVKAYVLSKEKSNEAAKKLMLASIIYLPLTQVFLIIQNLN